MENELPSRELMERKNKEFIEVLEQTEDNYNLSGEPCDDKFKVLKHAPPSDTIKTSPRLKGVNYKPTRENFKHPPPGVNVERRGPAGLPTVQRKSKNRRGKAK